jgi:hypothetical protein
VLGEGAASWRSEGHPAVGRTGRLGAYRIRAMRTFLATQRDWLVTERLPAYAPELNPV